VVSADADIIQWASISQLFVICCVQRVYVHKVLQCVDVCPDG